MGFEVYGTTFKIDERYTFVKALGKGAYGVVCSVKDAKTGKKLAIKKICPMAKSVYDAKHTLREIRLLRHCGAHPNVITLMDLMVNESADELYIGMECMDTDLHRIIQSSQKLSISHHKHFMYQLILGIEFLHSNGILHRDLKPANLLVSKNCDLRISDFGLARRAPNATDGKPLMTEHVVTRWYRPPELMLSPDGKYTAAVDVWSIGCIFAELLGRTPLFPGKNFVHQLQLIFDVIGTPKSQETSYIKNSQAIQFLRSLPNKGSVDLSSIYPHAGRDAIEFMSMCIKFSANNRITVAEALRHPFFANAPLRDKKIKIDKLDETVFCFDFEQRDLDERQLRDIIIQEVEDFNNQNKIRATNSKKSKLPGLGNQEDELREQLKRQKKKSRAMSARTSAKTSSKERVAASSARPHSASTYTKMQVDHHRMDVNEISYHGTGLRYKREPSKPVKTGTSSSSRKELSRLVYDQTTERENDPYAVLGGSDSGADGGRQKKKSRSSISRILSSAKLGSSSSSSAASSSSKTSTLSSLRKLPSVHRSRSSSSSSTSGTSRSRSSLSSSIYDNDPISPTSSDPDSPMSIDGGMSEHKHEPVSSMLPIKNILRKSKRHVNSQQPLKESSRPMYEWNKNVVHTNETCSTKRYGSSRPVTVPQPFNFSHPRNKQQPSLPIGTNTSYMSSSSSSSHYHHKSKLPQP